MPECVYVFGKKPVVCSQVLALCCLYNFRLGNLSCLADPEDLLVYKDTEVSSVIRKVIMNCTREGHSMPSILVGAEMLTRGFFIVFNMCALI